MEAASSPFRAASHTGKVPPHCRRNERVSKPGLWQIMKCLACSGEMRLMEVTLDRTTVCGIERYTFECSDCPHTAKRLVLNRSREPILQVVIPPETPIIDQHNARP